MSVTITPENLKTVAPFIRSDRALVYAHALASVLEPADITTALRVAHFIAQLAHETGGFRALVESTTYRKAKYLDDTFTNVQGVAHAQRLIDAGPQAIGNAIYANVLGNGGVASGDGYRFRGRGFIMVTGRANYRDLGARMAKDLDGKNLEHEPELLAEPEWAARAAAAFWKSRNINLAADRDDVVAATVLVNGKAKKGLAERREYLELAKKAWPPPKKKV